MLQNPRSGFDPRLHNVVLFARAALRTLLALPIALLAFSIFSNPNRTVAQIVTQCSGWLNVVWIAAVAATLHWMRRVQTWLDRRSFREDYQHEQVLVQDFGLAKVVGAGAGVSESLTEAGAVMGTFGYIAPEVFTGGPVDERADIFAIGVITVETLVGERPICGQTPHEVLTTLLHSEYHLPGEWIEIRGLDVGVQRCLAKDPRDHYGSATGVAKELVPALARCRLRSTPRRDDPRHSGTSIIRLNHTPPQPLRFG